MSQLSAQYAASAKPLYKVKSYKKEKFYTLHLRTAFGRGEMGTYEDILLGQYFSHSIRRLKKKAKKLTKSQNIAIKWESGKGKVKFITDKNSHYYLVIEKLKLI